MLASGPGGACTARVGAVLKEFNPNRIYQIFQIGRNRDLILNIIINMDRFPRISLN